MTDEKSLENPQDYGIKPSYCRNCRKRTISVKEESPNCFRCPECGKIK